MAAKKKTERDETDGGSPRSMRVDAAKKLAQSLKISPELKGQTEEALIHDLQVHQVELEMQADELRRAQLALEESRDKYLDLYEFAPVGYLTLTDKGLITEVNLTGAALLDVERSKLVNHRIGRFIADGEIVGWNRYIGNVLHREEKLTCHHILMKRGHGPEFHARLEGIRIKDIRGVTTIRIAFNDITEIRRAELELRESKRGLADIIEFLPDATFVIDRKGIVIAWNRAIEEMTGISKDGMIGHGDHEYAIPFYGERRKELMDLIDQDDEELKAKYQYVTRNGKTLYAEFFTPALYGGTGAYVWATVSPLFDVNGNRMGAIESIRDITERKQEEEALRESEERYHLINDSSLDSIYSYDRSGRFTSANRSLCAELNLRADQILGRLRTELGFPDAQCRDWDDLDRRVYETDATISALTSTLMPDGTIHHYEVVLNPLHDSAGTIIGIAGTTRDITERKRAEDAFKVANKKLKLLSSITRHDIDNQLMVLMGYLPILEKKQTDPTLNEYFQSVSTAAERISTMIRFTKTYENIGVNAPAWQDIRTLVDAATDDSTTGQVQLENDLPADAEVYADPLISRVFFNLIDNAVRYGGKFTTIRFSVRESGDDHIIVCEDDGIGIPAGEKEKVFERGFGQNTGLGLFLTREILDITGITISESGKPGKGARFEITVPKGGWRSAGEGD